jgi:excisionase family DNA binding protein
MCDEPVVFTVEEAAEVLRISRGSAYEAVRTGEIPSIRINRRILVPRERLLAVINKSGGDRTEPSTP